MFNSYFQYVIIILNLNIINKEIIIKTNLACKKFIFMIPQLPRSNVLNQHLEKHGKSNFSAILCHQMKYNLYLITIKSLKILFDFILYVMFIVRHASERFCLTNDYFISYFRCVWLINCCKLYGCSGKPCIITKLMGIKGKIEERSS